MKRSIFFILAIVIIAGNPLNGQGGLLKKVAKSMTNELMGKPPEVDRGPEPACACNDAKLVVDLGGKIQIDYTEVSLSVRDDGAILMKYRITGEYYIAKDGVTQGPIKAGDNRLAGFEADDESASDGKDFWLTKYGQYISKAGDKYLINFAGKTYGPYAQINGFVISKSKDKFAATVIETQLTTEADGKKMEAAMKNAKTDQERMDISMEYAQKMQEKMFQGGKMANVTPMIVSNVPNTTLDPMKGMGRLDNNIKYDDIVLNTGNQIVSLQGNTLISIQGEAAGAEKLFVNTANTKYAYLIYGELSFSDGSKKLNDLINPHLIKEAEKVYLAYMYYSPKKNAIMQCKIDF